MKINDLSEEILTKKEIFEMIYPIGSIYMSVSSTNPKTLLGFGEWSAWGSGRVPVGVNSSDTEFSSVEKTGGEKTHTLIQNEMPNHRHNVELTYYQNSTNFITNINRSNNGKIPAARSDATLYYYGTDFTEGGGYTQITNTGGSQAHNNLQPYITCYMWKRIS